MSAFAFNDAKEQVRQATNIVDLMGSYLQLRRQGRGFVALCPWHNDTRPSLQINPDRQSWKCWVCDIGGDAFSFVMKQEGVEFREALELLADRAGISLEAAKPQAPPGSPQDKKTLLAAAAWAEQIFHDCLLKADEAEPARAYLEERGFTPASVEQYRLGFSPNAWQWLADRGAKSKFSAEVLEAIDVIGKSESSGRLYDRFKGRVMFPIRDPQGRVIAFGGRILPMYSADEEKRTGRPPGKYINSRETKLFSKSDNLYGLDLAKDALSKQPGRREIIVFEGYTDVVMAHQAGLRNVVAVLGTAINARHIALLKRYTDQVTLVLDGDDAGQRRTNEVLELFVAEQVDLRVLTLPEGLDPCDFFLEHGADPFRLLLDGAVDAMQHKIRVATQGIDLVNDTHAANRALEEILATLAKTPKLQVGAGSDTTLREQQLLTMLARKFGVPDGDLRARLKDLRSKAQRTVAAKPAAVVTPRGKPANSPMTPRKKDDRLNAYPTTSGDISAANAAMLAAGELADELPHDLDAGFAPPTDFDLVESPLDSPAESVRPPRVQDFDPREVELIEILMVHPELAEAAIRETEIYTWKSPATRTIFRTIHEFFDDGAVPEFGRVLTALDDSGLKNVLVELDERAHAKAAEALQDAAARLRGLAHHFQHESATHARRQQQAALDNKRLDAEEELAALKMLVAQQQAFHASRMNQGTSAPMDGQDI